MRKVFGLLLAALARLPRPTGAGVFYLLLIALVIVQSHREQAPAVQNLLILIASAISGLVVSSGLVGYRALSTLRVRRILPPHAMLGLPVPVGLVIENVGLLPRGVVEVRMTETAHVGYRHTSDVSVYLAAKGAERLELSAVFLRRGETDLGGVTLTTAFPFGLLRYRRKVPLVDRVLVWPRPISLPAALKARLANGSIGEHAARRRGSDEVYGLREYFAGDPVSRIHWPTSARAGQPMLLELEGLRGPRCVVLLDTYEASSAKPASDSESAESLESGTAAARATNSTTHGDRESLISLAAGLLLDLEREGRACGLAMMDGDRLVHIQPGTGLGRRALLMDALARVGASSSEVGDWAGRVLAETPKDCVSVVITARPDVDFARSSRGVVVVSLADSMVQNAIEVSRLPSRRPRTSRSIADEDVVQEVAA